VNPGIAVMEVDEEYMVPVSYKMYYMNITKANADHSKGI
jgi:hypothetical protein